MRIAGIARTTLTTVLALLVAVIVTVATALSLAVALAATALIVPGTGTPNANIVGDYRENARDYYISPFNPACTEATDCVLQGIDYPAQFWPIPLPGWGGLSGAKWDVSTGEGLANLNSTLVNTLVQKPGEPVVMFGYSQGGNIVSRQKRNLSYLPKDQTYLSFVMIGNANRPNGGLFERLAFLGHVPILDATFGLPAPTDTCGHICATDIAFRYDGVADFPLYPLNLLAVANAIAGFWYVHGTYLAPNANSDPGELPDDYTPEELAEQLADEDNWQDHGDTRYITIPTKTLPIMRPFLEFANATGTGFLIKPLVKLLSPVLEVLIETGYDRTLSFGVPAPFRLIPRINPITLARDVIEALGQGFRDAFGKPAVVQQDPEAPLQQRQRRDEAPDVSEVSVSAESAESAEEAPPAAPLTRAEKRAALTEARSTPRGAVGARTDARSASAPALTVVTEEEAEAEAGVEDEDQDRPAVSEDTETETSDSSDSTDSSDSSDQAAA